MTHKADEDPTIVETLRKLQSRVQVWVKPTDRILTDADAYEYDLYRAEKISGKVSFQWGLSLTIFGILAGSITYYTCWQLVTGNLAKVEHGWGGWLFPNDVAGLVSVILFHLLSFPGVVIVKGNRKVRRVCGEIVGYCVLSLVLAALWSTMLFGSKVSGKIVLFEPRPFKVHTAARP
ncbi:hypothetical protein TWF106_000861 [Orbilia oligospora]|uniref:Uncharacterized protein n=1 Tax=Orbilia oligospora TaxID=2813651 RepID=A0A7C8QY92_ORBOL|nr:hypothetical protein TWF679_011185 [Orbilia oligospora]KAF3226368.1 hypothetical protein TWF106_000861 [Orbilia oligospora]